MDESLRYVQRMREHRGRPEIDQSIAGVIAAQAEQARKQACQFGRLAEAWQEVVPPHLVRQTGLVALQRGVLTVEVPSAAVRYQLETLLRQGLLRDLRNSYAGSLNRVKFRLAARAAGAAAGQHRPNAE